jgi:hypothetical protein
MHKDDLPPDANVLHIYLVLQKQHVLNIWLHSQSLPCYLVMLVHTALAKMVLENKRGKPNIRLQIQDEVFA